MKSIAATTVFLMLVMLSGYLLYDWAQKPQLFERMAQLESDAHKHWSENQLDQAYSNFAELISFENKEFSELDADLVHLNPIRLSSLHSFAGRIALQKKSHDAASQHFLTALELGSNDEVKLQALLTDSLKHTTSSEVLNQLRHLSPDLASSLFNNANPRYTNRYADGWSKGEESSALVYCEQDQCSYWLDFFVLNSTSESSLIDVTFNEQSVYREKINSGDQIQIMLEARAGVSKIDFRVDRITELSENDKRSVGLNYKIVML